MSAAESLAAERADCTSAPAGGAPGLAVAPERVSTGTIWRGAYQVGPSCGEPQGRWFTATQTDTGENVWLRVDSNATAADREQLWPVLSALDSPHLQRALEAHSGVERVEVWRAPGAPSLREWRKEHGAPDREDIRHFVRQMTAALELLHAQGVGHFALHPENIFARPGETSPQFGLGGLAAVQRVAQTELIPIAVDLLYAPPEAAGLFKHSPGPLLLAWDWWALGRVLQELILGQHVLLLVPDELHRIPPRSRMQMAEALLFERDIGSLRAGAVELMPRLDPDTTRLLHGLLTGAPEGRWSGAEVREWLAGARPSEHYAQSRHQRFFRLGGRGYTAPEAAQLLRGPEHWQESAAHVFGAEEPGRLAHFLRNNRSHQKYLDQLEQAAKLTQAPALRGVPPEMIREIAAAIALVFISGGEFLWRGQPLAAALAAMLESSPDIHQTCTLLRAFGLPVVLELLKQHDSSAAERLESLVAAAGEAEILIARCGLPRGNPKEDLRDLWKLAAEPTAKLAAKVEELRQICACTTNPALEKIFSTPNPGRGTLVLLAWTGRTPPRYGFKTHPEMKARKLAQLSVEGLACAKILFWLRLERALAAGPLLFGSRWPILAGSLTVVLLLAVHVPGPAGLALGLVPFAALAALRFGLHRWQAHLVRQWTNARSWTWRDRIPRCRAEVNQLNGGNAGPATSTAIAAKLRDINREITRLAPPDPHPTVPWPPRHWGVWLAAIASWLALLLLGAGSVWRGLKHPPSWTAHTAAWHKAFHPEKNEKAVSPEDLKLAWPYKLQRNSPFPPLEIRVEGGFEPTAEQQAAATIRAHQELDRYKKETIDTLVAIHVPLEGDVVGLLLYDGRKGAFLGRKGVVIKFIPFAKQWLKIGDQYAIFVEP